jgi:hypothetical protein
MVITASTTLEAPQSPRPPQTPSVESILCYRTLTGAQLVAQAQAIANVFFAVGKASSGESVFFIKPNQRRISYANGAAIDELASFTPSWTPGLSSAVSIPQAAMHLFTLWPYTCVAQRAVDFLHALPVTVFHRFGRGWQVTGRRAEHDRRIKCYRTRPTTSRKI